MPSARPVLTARKPRELRPAPDPQTVPPFLRPKEFAELSGFPESTIRELIKTGDIDLHKVGRRVFIPRSEAERLKRETLRPARNRLSYGRYAA